MAHAEFYRDKANEWRWRCKADNGETVAQGESHSTASGAQTAFLTAARNMSEAASNLITSHD